MQTMARAKTNPSTSVTFRLPDESLQGIENLAERNSHDRTAELIGACRHWVEIGGSAGVDTSLNEKVDCLQKKMDVVEAAVLEMSDTMKRIEEINTTLIRILEKIVK